MPRGHYLRRTRDVADRLFDKFTVDPETECWNWSGSTVCGGYGQIGMGSRQAGDLRVVNAHIASWLIHFGPIEPGLFVCHRCDNRRCVNPDHLFLGTKADNSRDMVTKGRQAVGFRLPQTKLSDEEILAIRGASGVSQLALAKRFGVSQGYVSMIRRGLLPARLTSR
jgi:hypothetical protein